MIALIFDTETTNLPPRNCNSWETMLLKFPNIIQFSFILFDQDKCKILESHDYIIKVPLDTDISEGSIKLHGITMEISQSKGILIKDALKIFEKCYKKADVIVAHNLEFDKKMVQVESLRAEMATIIDEKHNKEFYCTMQNSIDLCNIIATNMLGPYKKFPRQNELHLKLFGTEPKNLHNSFNDILVCLRCYIKMKMDKDVTEKNAKLKKMFLTLLQV